MSAGSSTAPSLCAPGLDQCPFNIFFHGVACELVRTELEALGLRTVFVPLAIDIDEGKEWAGVARKYWKRDTYYLPVSVYLPATTPP